MDRTHPPHSMPAEDVLHALGTNIAGLGATHVSARLRQYGPNRLPQPRGRPAWAIYLAQYRGPFIYLLLAAGASSMALGHWTDAGFILIVLQLNAAIGAYQEWRAESQARALNRLVTGRAQVRRAGTWHRITIEHLVPGDIVALERGHRVPADLRLIDAQELRADESLLTGESVPVDKVAHLLAAREAAIADRRNMLHAGTMILSGRALAVVWATGVETELGKIAESLREEPSPPPPLILRMRQFTRRLAVAVTVLILIIAVLETAKGADILEIGILAIALAVSAIPEGLPISMTVALAVAARRLAARHVVVRNLSAVEGLGSCTVILSDKTGTLTQNRLTVTQVWLPDGGERNPSDPSVGHLSEIALHCCDAALISDHVAASGGDPVGDTVDLALIAWVRGLDRPIAASRRRGGIAYEPERKFCATFFESKDGPLIAVKGAPETVLPMCAVSDTFPDTVLEAARDMAGAGLRVLAIAGGPHRLTDAGLPTGLALEGLIGLQDPLRPESKAAVGAALGAGIDVRIVTGDHPATALAIARDLGIDASPHAVMTGAALSAIDVQDAARILSPIKIFARTEPLQKKMIVEALKQAGEFVAVTGDGANDAPALQAAHIGVAMGRSGTDVAREAADLILADDNFASLVAGIEQGRAAYDNIRKVVWLLLVTGAAEILLFLLATLAGLPPPLTAAQLLWLNLVTNGIQDVALGFEGPEPRLLQRRPRPPSQPIVDKVMLNHLIVGGSLMGAIAFGYYLHAFGQGDAFHTIQNALLWLMVCLENAHCLNCRSETRSILRIPLSANLYLVIGIAAAQALQILATFSPSLRDALGVSSLTVDEWLFLAGLGLLIIPAIELQKFLTRRKAVPKIFDTTKKI